MPFVPAGALGEAGGGGGLILGPATNSFTGSDEAAAESARDTYATANSDWLADYDANPNYVIILTYGSTTTYQARREDDWADVTPLVVGPRGLRGDDGDQARFVVTVYQNAATAPASAPTGGSYNIATGVLTAPTGASTARTTPGDAETAYASQAIINPAVDTGSVTPTWSSWFELSDTGTSVSANPSEAATAILRKATISGETFDVESVVLADPTTGVLRDPTAEDWDATRGRSRTLAFDGDQLLKCGRRLVDGHTASATFTTLAPGSTITGSIYRWRGFHWQDNLVHAPANRDVYRKINSTHFRHYLIDHWVNFYPGDAFGHNNYKGHWGSQTEALAHVTANGQWVSYDTEDGHVLTRISDFVAGQDAHYEFVWVPANDIVSGSTGDGSGDPGDGSGVSLQDVLDAILAGSNVTIDRSTDGQIAIASSGGGGGSNSIYVATGSSRDDRTLVLTGTNVPVATITGALLVGQVPDTWPTTSGQDLRLRIEYTDSTTAEQDVVDRSGTEVDITVLRSNEVHAFWFTRNNSGLLLFEHLGTWGSGTGGISESDADGRYLRQSENLGDLDDPAAARTNLDVFSDDEVLSRLAAAQKLFLATNITPHPTFGNIARLGIETPEGDFGPVLFAGRWPSNWAPAAGETLNLNWNHPNSNVSEYQVRDGDNDLVEADSLSASEVYLFYYRRQGTTVTLRYWGSLTEAGEAVGDFATTDLGNVDSDLTAAEREAFRDKVESMDRDLEDLAGDLTQAEQSAIAEKLGLERGFSTIVLGHLDSLEHDGRWMRTGIFYPENLRAEGWLLVRVNQGTYRWLHGDEILESPAITLTTPPDTQTAVGDEWITRYFEIYERTNGQTTPVYTHWGRTAERELLLGVPTNFDLVAHGPIEVRLVREVGASPAAEQLVFDDAVTFSGTARHSEAGGGSSFVLSRPLTAHDDQKLFVGDARFEDSDATHRTNDRGALQPFRAKLLRCLYEQPTKDRSTTLADYEPPDDWGGRLRFIMVRNGRDDNNNASLVSCYYSGEFLSRLSGSVVPAGDELTLDDASGVSVGDTLIAHGDNGTDDFTEFMLVTAISSNTVTVDRNQSGTYTRRGERQIRNRQPIYLHDRRTFFLTNAVGHSGTPGGGLVDNFADFDGFLLSYSDDPRGVESFEIDDDGNVTLTLRGGITINETIPGGTGQQQQGVAYLTDHLTEITLWADVAEGSTPDDPTVAWRFDGGWQPDSGVAPWPAALASDASEWGDWGSDRPSAGVASGMVRWSARRRFTRTEDSDGNFVYGISGSWAVLAEFDTQYSEDGTSWHDDQEDDDIFIRMRDDNGEWVTWTIGDVRGRLEVVRNWMMAYGSTTSQVRSYLDDVDLSVFRYLLWEFQAFKFFDSDGEITEPTKSLFYQMHRPVDGYGISARSLASGISQEWNQVDDHNVIFDSRNGEVQVRYRPDGDGDYALSRPDHLRDGDNRPVRTSFMMRMKVDGASALNNDANCEGFAFHSFQVAWDRIRVRVLGMRA